MNPNRTPERQGTIRTCPGAPLRQRRRRPYRHDLVNQFGGTPEGQRRNFDVQRRLDFENEDDDIVSVELFGSNENESNDFEEFDMDDEFPVRDLCSCGEEKNPMSQICHYCKSRCSFFTPKFPHPSQKPLGFNIMRMKMLTLKMKNIGDEKDCCLGCFGEKESEHSQYCSSCWNKLKS